MVNGPVQQVEACDVARDTVEAVAEQREDRRFIEGGEALDPVAIAVRDKSGVVGKPCDAVSVRPAAEIVERLRHVPVIEAKPRLDTGGKDRVDQPVIQCQARLVRCPAPLRQKPRPGDGKTVGLDAEPLHQRDVFGIATVMVAGDIAGVVVGDFAFLAARVPDAGAAAVFARRALDLKA